MASRPYAGSARPVSSRYENDPAYEPAEDDHPDGSIIRGYRRKDTGVMVFGNIVAGGESPARLAASAQAAADKAAEDAQTATFKQSIRDLAQKVKNNTATAAEQRQLIVKLARVADNVLADL